ncbi:MAG: DUF3093 domain-containing protein [Nocardioides sp.]|nr:DUF3093 domain-containing protein [Nocardioides sp.]
MEYAERLTVPLRWWVQGTMLVASLWLAVAVALPSALASALIALAGMALMTAAFLTYGSARVCVVDGELRAGRAHIAVGLLGAADPLDAESTRLVAGRDADARAYLMLRPYLKQSVRVAIEDPDDPAPYWLVSTRHPERLAAALGEHALG